MAMSKLMMATSRSAPYMPTPKAPPDAVPSVLPTSTRVQQLPFEALTWENFERLCLRLTALHGDVEHCARYGTQGEAQEGIDIFARQVDGKYHCLQAKRHRSFGATKLLDAVDLFVSGSWASRAVRFTVAVQTLLGSTQVQEEIERQAVRLTQIGITFVTLDGEGLTDCLREHPKLVDDFFGRNWVAALLGQDVADGLGKRLDGEAFARVRAQLRRVYEAQFQFFDPGSFGSIGDEDGRPALTLLERFLKPDILVRERVRSLEGIDTGVANDNGDSSNAPASTSLAGRDETRATDVMNSSRMRRLPIIEWLGDGDRLVLLGDAGCGKSTVLRVIALDLLGEQTHFPELVEDWGDHIPIYIPFARWSSQVTRDGNSIGIKEIVRRSLEQFLTSSITDLLDRAIDDQRVLLLIDGLDEWSSEQSARTTLSSLVTNVEAHSIPIIVSGRPRGLDRIGALPINWKRGAIAPLSTLQQSTIAGRWFGRYASTAPDNGQPSDSSLRTDWFMAELARDANLGALAALPLLLIGLVTLTLRGQILPRTKGDIYDQLVRLLLEVHPANRATASGDTEPRFRHAIDPDTRRAAIARLAFAVREQAGGAEISQALARDILRNYLSSPQGFDLSESEAAAAATEILAVNAETQGLVIEKAPGEIGFVHASFEEFLGAEHVGGWPLSDIERFVRENSGNGRWRNVISNLLGRIQRRDEFDRLVATIEAQDTDQVANFHRQVLLGDIAFSGSMRAPATTRRLALMTMDRVETDDWLPARHEALASVLKGLSDPTFKADIEQRLACWLPARHSYRRASLISSLGEWQPTTQLQNLLYRAMQDEDHGVQRAAAAAYSKVFSPSTAASQRLLEGLAKSRDLSSSAAFLESLALGWPTNHEVALLFSEAWNSHSAELCLVGILGLAVTGSTTQQARDAVLRGQSMWSDISYPHRELAAAMLLKYWSGDDTLIRGALSRMMGDFRSHWEHDVASAFLMESPVDRSDVRTWILAELRKDFAFNVARDRRIWSQVGRFAAEDPEIRAAANAYWCEPENRIIGMYKMPGYVKHVADPPVAAALIEVLSKKERKFDRYWALSSLLAGWGRDHPEVKATIDALRDAPDDELEDLVSFLPEIMPDKATARNRLLELAKREGVRCDLLAIGLEACGCDANDSEAISALLAFPVKLRGLFDASETIFRVFGAHAEIRSLALTRVQEVDAPLAAIASAYANDAEFAPLLFGAAVPLPVDLRTQIVEVATAGATGTTLEASLARAMIESDPELRTRMVIAHHRSLPPEAHDMARKALLERAVAVGPDYESVRAAALAGLVAIGSLDSLVELEDRGKPVALVTGGLIERIPSVERLICESFKEFESLFGDGLSDRFKSHRDRSQLADILSTAPGASPSARAAFLSLAERGEIPRTQHALRALASERPRSELLLSRCWDILESHDQRNDRAMVSGEVGLLLREHFPGNTDVSRRLLERYKEVPEVATALPLVIFEPSAEELPFPIEFEELGHRFADWTVAVHVAASRADSTTFCKLLEAMVGRRQRSKFDAQQITNLAIHERLQWDQELEGLLSGMISQKGNPSITGSFARYLAAAGKLNVASRSQVIDILRVLGADQRLPIAGYDAIADQWRSTRATLFDAVSAGLDLG